MITTSSLLEEASIPRGFHYLVQHTRDTLHLDQCHGDVLYHKQHPFKLETSPVCIPGLSQEFIFAGEGSTDRTVELFLAHIRFWIGPTEDNGLNYLRAIEVKDPTKREPDQRYVLFELGIRNMTIISGQTNNFSGAGQAARQELADVFALLSAIYHLDMGLAEVVMTQRHMEQVLRSGRKRFG